MPSAFPCALSPRSRPRQWRAPARPLPPRPRRPPAPARLTEDRSAGKPQPVAHHPDAQGRRRRRPLGSPARARAGSRRRRLGAGRERRPGRSKELSEQGLRLVAAQGAAAQEPSEQDQREAAASTDARSPSRTQAGSPVVRTVKDIVEVVPKPVKILLGGARGHLGAAGRRLSVRGGPRAAAGSPARRPAAGGGPAPDRPAAAGARHRGSRAHVGGLPAVGRARRGGRLLRRAHAARRQGGLHPRRRVGPRPAGPGAHRVRALHAARLPRGRPGAAHRAAGGGPRDRPAPRRPLRHRRDRRARSLRRVAHLRLRRPSGADRGGPHTARADPGGVVAADRPGAAYRRAPDHAAAAARLGGVPLHGRPGRVAHRGRDPRAPAAGRHRGRAGPRRHGGRAAEGRGRARRGWSPTTWPRC